MGKVVQEPKLVCCRSMLVIGPLGAMRLMLVIFKSPGTYAGHKYTRPSGLEYWESMLVIVCYQAWMPGDWVEYNFRFGDRKPRLSVLKPEVGAGVRVASDFWVYIAEKSRLLSGVWPVFTANRWEVSLFIYNNEINDCTDNRSLWIPSILLRSW